MTVKMIGLHGEMGSGKDTAFDRLARIHIDDMAFVRVSFADALKSSASALLDVSVEDLDSWKRDGSSRIKLYEGDRLVKDMTIRTYLQRYGTESHRDVFGDDFWVSIGIRKAFQISKLSIVPSVPVFTDVRFSNEAQAILDLGGEVWRIVGPDERSDGHVSEVPLPDHMISRVIDNKDRSDSFAGLDRQLSDIAKDIRVGFFNEEINDSSHRNADLPAVINYVSRGTPDKEI